MEAKEVTAAMKEAEAALATLAATDMAAEAIGKEEVMGVAMEEAAMEVEAEAAEAASLATELMAAATVATAAAAAVAAVAALVVAAIAAMPVVDAEAKAQVVVPMATQQGVTPI